MDRTQPSNRAARLAVLGMFFVNGALLATWVSRIPHIQESLELSEGGLGLVLIALSVGVLTALAFVGGLIARHGSRRFNVIAAGLVAVLLVPLGLMPSALGLWVSLFLFGAALSTMDVAMNAQAVEVEQRTDRVLMSSFHAAFSIGGLAGAGFGAAITGLGVEPGTHFVLVTEVSLVIILLVARYLVDERKSPESESESAPVFQLPPRMLWPLGLVAFCTAIGEGSMADWSAVYLNSVVGTTEATAALGYAAFSLTMTGGRLMGDWLTTQTTPAKIVRVGGLVAALGLLAAILWPQTWITLIGFAAVGAGVAISIPLTFSAAGRIPGVSSGAGIAGVATIGYAGFLAGPPIIGLIAEITSLRIALLLATLLIASLVFTGRALNVAPKMAPAAAD